MKHPPLIQVMFVVMILGVLNVQMQGSPLADWSMKQLVAVAVALLGAGMVVTPLMMGKRDDSSPETEPKRADDDLDLSA